MERLRNDSTSDQDLQLPSTSTNLTQNVESHSLSDEPRRLSKYGASTEPPIDDYVFCVPDDTYSFLAKGRDFEPAYINHQYTAKEKVTLASFESLDYLPSHSDVYKNWIKRQKGYRYEFDRWIMMGLIGVSVGLIGFLLHQFIEVIFEWKWTLTRRYIEMGENEIAWGVCVSYTVLFVLIASSTVVFLRPSASGSGIPEVIGFLNGTVVRHIFNVKTMAVKFVSCICAIGCGMPLAPEGPMIHLGSSVGAGLSQFRSETLRFNLPFFTRFRNSEERRNFISAGAAAGVASAFGAPVGGLLFSMEEVSSFWNMKLTWQIFFCCMLSTFTTDVFNSAFSAFSYTGNFGQFVKKRYILFNITNGIDVNILMFVPTVLIGLIGGVLGALFTFLNLKATRLRRKLLSQIKSAMCQKFYRVLEPIIFMIIVTTFTIYIPRAFPCSQYTCTNSTHNNVQYNCYNDSRTVYHTEMDVADFMCPPGVVYRDPDNAHRWLTNKTYNELATLLFQTSEGSVKHLFSRDTHVEFSYSSLFIILPFYFVIVCLASGMSVSCGILVPMIYIGALYGRIVGVAMVSLFGVYTKENSYWAWMDPGAMALIGAASFFGGVSRLTMAVTVIMLELTNDVQFLLPIMVAVMISKWVGDYFTHPLYHALLELKCIPFLDQDPTSVTVDKKHTISLELFTASDAMISPVVTLRPHETVATLAHHLLHTKHGGFPVVESCEGKDVFIGLITRLEIVVLLEHDELFEDIDQSDESTPSDITCVEYQQLLIDKLDDPRRVTDMLQTYCTDDKYSNLYINLRPFINKSAVSIPTAFSLHRAYIIFRSLGLRHMTVTNVNNTVAGIITRKDLMGFNIEARLSNIMNRQRRDYLCTSDIQLDSVS